MTNGVAKSWFFIMGVTALSFSDAVCAQQGVNVTINGATQDPMQSPNLTADISSGAYAATLTFSGNTASKKAESQKCSDLVDLAGNDPIPIFGGAVSSSNVTLTLVENRAADGLGKAWNDAHRIASESGHFDFDRPPAGSDFPYVTSVGIDTTAAPALGKATKSTRELMKANFLSAVRESIAGQLTSYNSTGIIRVQTSDQASVCFALLASKLHLSLIFRARTYDRRVKKEILDQQCVSEKLNLLNDKLAEATYKFAELKNNSGSFNLLLGSYLADKSSGGWIFDTKQNNFCIAGKDKDLIKNLDALKQWTLIFEKWRQFSTTKSDFRLSATELSGFSEITYTQSLTPTFINFKYDTNVEVGGSQ